MNTISPQALLCAARVQAALKVVPQIVGEKEDWAKWMAEGLHRDLQAVGFATAESPQPRLLGSLNRVLLEYFSASMDLELLHLDQVRPDDALVGCEHYRDVPTEALPEPTGEDLWWKHLPGSRKSLFSFDFQKTQRKLIKHTPMSEGPSGTFPGSAASQGPSGTVPGPASSPGLAGFVPGPGSGSSVSAPLQTGSKKKRAAAEEGASRPQKKKKKEIKSKPTIDSDDDGNEDDRPQAGPSTASTVVRKGKGKEKEKEKEKEKGKGKGKGKEKAQEERETTPEPRICDQCRRRNSVCKWPKKPATSLANMKQACSACVTGKTRCEIEGVFVIRKKKAGISVGSEQLLPLMQQVDGLQQRIHALEAQHEVDVEEKKDQRDRIAALQTAVDQWKRASSA
ncbi:hypothetical protein BV22DRAFT_1135049 [Leucogyrophana mollusca]|uniref:Uncharacterized protein n=1 Tax=Leucogyrophana mollusca TaxID=85980 RepID=A0ACB8AWX3_9AGAM|nr:hypothetical protein BV22DRAFT_1135049 [Leucogyrophana mollusca]